MPHPAEFAIRPEEPGDIPALRTINELAFGQSDEADLVDVLRRDCPVFVSWVALVAERVVGHLLFTPALLETGDPGLPGMALAPLAVAPEWQKQGIGTALMQTGLAALDAASCPFSIVLGHPAYYARFGFVAASRFGIRCQWEVPPAAFLIRFRTAAPANLEGCVARYRNEFDALV